MFSLKPHVGRQTAKRFKVVIWETRFDLGFRKAEHSLRPFLFIAFYWVAELLTAAHFFFNRSFKMGANFFRKYSRPQALLTLKMLQAGNLCDNYVSS